MRRGLSIGLAVLLFAGVVLTVVLTRRGGDSDGMTLVRGVIGSEKQPFFDDPEVKAAFRQAGFDVQVDTAGSRQIAAEIDLSAYDFAFPAGTPQAERIRRDRNARATYVPFSTPMAIASFEPIVQLLASAGVARDEGGWWSFDIRSYLDLVAGDKRWSDLPDNSSYQVNKQILITSTDLATSNSAAMYASIASYVDNNNSVVADPGAIGPVADVVAPLFARQGYTEQSSEAPFEDYLAIGIGKTPMVMVYEAQFVARAASGDGSIKPGMVLMYPEPTIVSKHTLVPLTDNGDAIGRLLSEDETLRQLAVRYGFRTSDPAAFQNLVSEANVATAPQLLDVIEPPSFDNLEALIEAIAAQMATGAGAAGAPGATDPTASATTLPSSTVPS